MFDQLKNLAAGVLGNLNLDEVLKMFPNEFISQNSKFTSFNELLNNFGFDAAKDGIEKLTSQDFSGFLKNNSTFESLQDMISKLGK